MARISKNKLTFFVVVTVIVAVIAYDYFQRQAQLSEGMRARFKGSPDAKAKIVEYIDFQCPACARGSKYLMEYIKSHPDRVSLQMKYYPLNMHTHAFISARYAECAARQDKFWVFHDFLILNQREWKKLVDAQPMFDKMAEMSKMNIDQLKNCLNSDQVKQTILNDKQEGTTLGIKSTPTYFVNGKMVVGLKSLKQEFADLFGEDK